MEYIYMTKAEKENFIEERINEILPLIKNKKANGEKFIIVENIHRDWRKAFRYALFDKGYRVVDKAIGCVFIGWN